MATAKTTAAVPPNQIRVLVVDAHAGVRGAIATFVEACEDMELVGMAETRAPAAHIHATSRPDVALVGLTLQDAGCVDAIAAILRRWPGARVLAMGSYQEEEYRQAALAAGAVGYLQKSVSADELGAAIRAAHAMRPGPGEPVLPLAHGQD